MLSSKSKQPLINIGKQYADHRLKTSLHNERIRKSSTISLVSRILQQVDADSEDNKSRRCGQRRINAPFIQSHLPTLHFRTVQSNTQWNRQRHDNQRRLFSTTASTPPPAGSTTVKTEDVDDKSKDAGTSQKELDTTNTPSAATSNSTISSSSSSSPSQSSSPSSNNSTTNEPPKVNPYSRTSRFRQQAGEFRDQAVERYGEAQDKAKETYDYVRSNPRESANSMGSMIKRYGPVFLGTYFTVYGATLGGLFVCVESGLLDPAGLFELFGHGAATVAGGGEDCVAETKNTVDFVVEFMENHTLTKPIAPWFQKNPSMTNFAVAWIATKFTEPIRFAFAVGITPKVARYTGYGPAAIEEQGEQQAKEETTNKATDKTTKTDSPAK